MAIEIVDIADLDCIYLTYDEPQKEKFWVEISNMVPWAKRVDGVKGSDAAHKAAARTSSTERFILIDGDNMPDKEFFNLQLKLDDSNKDCVFRWKARNSVNGLMYGNGGISCWTKKFVNEMKTHENSEGNDATDVEFCFDTNYVPMHNCYSTSHINYTNFQAWRAGFREGVKLCLRRGTKTSNFPDDIPKRNLDHLCIWHSVGTDVGAGRWAMLGARMGTYYTMLSEKWDHRDVQDFDLIEKFYRGLGLTEGTIRPLLIHYDKLLKNAFKLHIVMYDSDESEFFKHHYSKTQINLDIMTKEIDVIRKQEGW